MNCLPTSKCTEREFDTTKYIVSNCNVIEVTLTQKQNTDCTTEFVSLLDASGNSYPETSEFVSVNNQISRVIIDGLSTCVADAMGGGSTIPTVQDCDGNDAVPVYDPCAITAINTAKDAIVAAIQGIPDYTAQLTEIGNTLTTIQVDTASMNTGIQDSLVLLQAIVDKPDPTPTDLQPVIDKLDSVIALETTQNSTLAQVRDELIALNTTLSAVQDTIEHIDTDVHDIIAKLQLVIDGLAGLQSTLTAIDGHVQDAITAIQTADANNVAALDSVISELQSLNINTDTLESLITQSNVLLQSLVNNTDQVESLLQQLVDDTNNESPVALVDYVAGSTSVGYLENPDPNYDLGRWVFYGSNPPAPLAIGVSNQLTFPATGAGETSHAEIIITGLELDVEYTIDYYRNLGDANFAFGFESGAVTSTTWVATSTSTTMWLEQGENSPSSDFFFGGLTFNNVVSESCTTFFASFKDGALVSLRDINNASYIPNGQVRLDCPMELGLLEDALKDAITATNTSNCFGNMAVATYDECAVSAVNTANTNNIAALGLVVTELQAVKTSVIEHLPLVGCDVETSPAVDGQQLIAFGRLASFWAESGWSVNFAPGPTLPYSKSNTIDNYLTLVYSTAAPIPAGCFLQFNTTTPLSDISVGFDIGAFTDPAMRQPTVPSSVTAGAAQQVALPNPLAGDSQTSFVVHVASSQLGQISGVSIWYPDTEAVIDTTTAVLTALDACSVERIKDSLTDLPVSIAGAISIDNFPATQQVSGTVSIAPLEQPTHTPVSVTSGTYILAAGVKYYSITFVDEGTISGAYRPAGYSTNADYVEQGYATALTVTGTSFIIEEVR